MDVLNNAVRTVVKRPFIIIFTAVLVFAYSLLNTYNPIIPIIIGLANITGGSVFESMVSAIQVVMNPELVPIILLVMLGGALLGSLASGLLFSGYMNVLYKTAGDFERKPGQFMEGFKKYFLGIFLMTLRALLAAELLVICLLVSCVPAAVVSRAAMSEKPELIPAAIFIDLLTVLVLFFGMMFSRAYLFFWFPAYIKGGKKPFLEGKQFADRNFWGIAGRLLVFDIVFAVFQYIIYITGNSIAQFVLTWVFDTCFFTVLSIYVFSAYAKKAGETERSAPSIISPEE